MADDDSTVQVEQDGPILHVRLNRPRQLNAFTAEMGSDLKRAFEETVPASGSRVVVMSGHGGNFMAGADLSLLEHWTTLGSAELMRTFEAGFDAGALSQCAVPVVCAVDGIAFGLGFDLTMAADYVVATDRAQFGLPETNVGVVPMGASTYHLQARVGVARALRVQLLGQPLSAAQAMDWGLVAEVVAPEDLAATVAKVAGRIVARSPVAMLETKRLVRAVAAEAASRALAAEQAAMIRCLGQPDVLEGVAAVREKRRPRYF
jgi:enoyl-CoA hydratase/carnithine racemase